MEIRELSINVFLFSCAILVCILMGAIAFLIERQINWGFVYKSKVDTEIRTSMKHHIEQYHKEKK